MSRVMTNSHCPVCTFLHDDLATRCFHPFHQNEAARIQYLNTRAPGDEIEIAFVTLRSGPSADIQRQPATFLRYLPPMEHMVEVAYADDGARRVDWVDAQRVYVPRECEPLPGTARVTDPPEFLKYGVLDTSSDGLGTHSRPVFREFIYRAIDSERDYQDKKWVGHTHDLESYVLFMEEYLARLRTLCTTNDFSDPKKKREAMHVLRKVITLGVAAAEEHGGLPFRS